MARGGKDEKESEPWHRREVREQARGTKAAASCRSPNSVEQRMRNFRTTGLFQNFNQED